MKKCCDKLEKKQNTNQVRIIYMLIFGLFYCILGGKNRFAKVFGIETTFSRLFRTANESRTFLPNFFLTYFQSTFKSSIFNLKNRKSAICINYAGLGKANCTF